MNRALPSRDRGNWSLLFVREIPIYRRALPGFEGLVGGTSAAEEGIGLARRIAPVAPHLAHVRARGRWSQCPCHPWPTNAKSPPRPEPGGRKRSFRFTSGSYTYVRPLPV